MPDTPAVRIAVDSYGDALTFAPWGSANDVDTTQMQTNGLKTVACLSGAQCVTTDDAQTFTFRTSADFGPNGTTIDHAHHIAALACPSTTQCTAVDNGGFGVTFDPATNQAASPVELRAGGGGEPRRDRLPVAERMRRRRLRRHGADVRSGS